MSACIITVALQIVSLLSVLVLCVKYVRLKETKENEYYTDYRHNNLILRIYKTEFEYMAIGKVPRNNILDQGTFSPTYMWALLIKE